VRRRILRTAAGLQCSGTPTYEQYTTRNENTLLFFDNRVPVDEVISPEALETKLAALVTGDRPLRLVFGGRLVPMKGVLELPEIATRLAQAGVAFSFEIVGSGPLEAQLAQEIARRGLGRRMHLRGALDFRTGWIPHLREHADLFVCCHTQGDPSSTYPEVMSCGVPIAGYANDAFRGIVEHSDAGWTVPLRDRAALAGILARLAGERREIAAIARRAREFALQHAFERTFARRTAHLVRSSRLPPDARARALERIEEELAATA
jgi:glycosyltransferase involved in cell wall biosynthesis